MKTLNVTALTITTLSLTLTSIVASLLHQHNINSKQSTVFYAKPSVITLSVFVLRVAALFLSPDRRTGIEPGACIINLITAVIYGFL